MNLKELNQKRWNNCKVYSSRGPLFEKVASRIKANKPIYDRVEKATGVPWWFVGITHYRESNLNLKTQLGQGDPLDQVSRHVPKGRGPFKTFEDGAYDALVNCAPYAAKNKDWSIGGALAMFEKYNGLGYYHMGKPSPYVWAGTDQYAHGKYTSDGHYDDGAVDSQLGCAGLMKYLGVGKTSVTKPLVAATVGTGALFSTWWSNIASHWILYSLAFLLIATGAYYIYTKIRKNEDVTKDQAILPEHLDEGGRLGKTDVE